VTNAIAAPSLGRNLTSGQNTVNLLVPGQQYGDRVNQVDLRFGKNLRFGRTRSLIALDVYNLLNSNAGLTYQQGFAFNAAGQTAWMNPSTLLMPRFMRFNVTFDF
jgi:hypothetical protein